MKIVTFPLKNRETPKSVVGVLLEKDTYLKNIEIVEDFVEKVQQQRQTLEIVEDFDCEDKTLEHLPRLRIFQVFLFFLHCSIFPFFHFLNMFFFYFVMCFCFLPV